jgi:hypothetical protein
VKKDRGLNIYLYMRNPAPKIIGALAPLRKGNPGLLGRVAEIAEKESPADK